MTTQRSAEHWVLWSTDSSNFCSAWNRLKEGTSQVWRTPWIQSEGWRVTWHKIQVTRDQGKAYFTLDGQYGFHVDVNRQTFGGIQLFDLDGNKDVGYEVAAWMLRSLSKEIRSFLQDPDRYQHEFFRRLPLRYRLGKIQRKHTWTGKRGKHFLRNELTRNQIQAFKQTALTCDLARPLQEVTRDDFLRFCAIGYDAIFPCQRKLSDLAKYRRHADGRHDGLLDLPGKDAKAMRNWLNRSADGIGSGGI